MRVHKLKFLKAAMLPSFLALSALGCETTDTTPDFDPNSADNHYPGPEFNQVVKQTISMTEGGTVLTYRGYLDESSKELYAYVKVYGVGEKFKSYDIAVNGLWLARGDFYDHLEFSIEEREADYQADAARVFRRMTPMDSALGEATILLSKNIEKTDINEVFKTLGLPPKDMLNTIMNAIDAALETENKQDLTLCEYWPIDFKCAEP